MSFSAVPEEGTARASEEVLGSPKSLGTDLSPRQAQGSRGSWETASRPLEQAASLPGASLSPSPSMYGQGATDGLVILQGTPRGPAEGSSNPSHAPQFQGFAFGCGKRRKEQLSSPHGWAGSKPRAAGECPVDTPTQKGTEMRDRESRSTRIQLYLKPLTAIPRTFSDTRPKPGDVVTCNPKSPEGHWGEAVERETTHQVPQICLPPLLCASSARPSDDYNNVPFTQTVSR